MANVPIYTEQGGAAMTVDTGATLTVNGTLAVDAGATVTGLIKGSQQDAIADLADPATATAEEIATAHNALLAALRLAGVIAAE